jgi:peptide/nickel transport system permease protein
MLIGSRVSISIGVVAVLISLIVESFFFGGRRVFWRESGCGDYVACEYYLVHPTLLLVIAITLALGKGFGRFLLLWD